MVMYMKVEDLIVLGKGQVHSDFAKMLLADLLNMNALELYNHLDDIVLDDVKEKYLERLDLLRTNKPIQYVMGNVNFYGLPFLVNEHVLIPRFETEELVENTLSFIQKKFGDNPIRIIDLGCGSGVIGLTLKHFLPNAEVTLLDISEDALEVAKTNAQELQLDVHFLLGDMLTTVTEKFDVIISNPPYIETEEEIDPLVKNNEPSLALYGGVDGLDFYRQILNSCSKNLKKDFLIAFEIGYHQKSRITELALKTFGDSVDICCKRDLSNRDRMLFISSR